MRSSLWRGRTEWPKTGNIEVEPVRPTVCLPNTASGPLPAHRTYRHPLVAPALGLFEELGDQTGQADSNIALGAVFQLQGRPGEALPHAQQAFILYRAAGWRGGCRRDG